MSRFGILGIGTLWLLSTLTIGCATTGSNPGGGDTLYASPAPTGGDVSDSSASFNALAAPASAKRSASH